MQFFVLGLLVLLLFLLFGRRIEQADPKVLARHLRRFGGLGALGLAALFALTGRLVVAIPLAMFGLGLLGRGFALSFPGSSGARKAPGQSSSVRTAYIEMALDHDSGAIDGRVLRGAFAGRSLSALTEPELRGLLGECAAVDPEGARLVEAYLDRTAPGWRDQAGTGQRGDAGAEQNGAGAAAGGVMSETEAYQILGLRPGARPEEIRAAHHTLIKRFHPDQGGSSYLAAKINQAKDVLLRKHGAS